LVVRSIVLIDLRASQENALLKRAQLTCRQDEHTHIKVVITSEEIRCAAHGGSGSNFPPLPSDGAKSRAEAASRITWAALNAKRSESKRTRTQEPILSGCPSLPPINRGTTDSWSRSANSRRSSDFRADVSFKRVWRSMPCCWASGCISGTSLRTALFKERPWALRSLAKSIRFDTLSVKRILRGSTVR